MKEIKIYHPFLWLMILSLAGSSCNNSKPEAEPGDEAKPTEVTEPAPAEEAKPDENQGMVFKHELIGTYIAGTVYAPGSNEGQPADPGTTGNWSLRLEDKDNFELRVNGKSVSGYWGFATGDNQQNRLLFQSGDLPENTIYAQFSKTEIFFDQPLAILDSAYRGVIFKRVEKQP